ncbi:MAG: stage IV sporulation protein FB [Myxococcota bacterium]|jgi:stage IV sporulation protein FB
MQPLNFQLATYDVTIQPTFLLLVAYFGLMTLQGGNVVGAVTIVCVVFLSLLMHELGHAAAARRLKVRHGPVVLHGFGGYVQHQATTPARQLLISLAGPAAMLVVGLPVALALDAGAVPEGVLVDVAWYVAVINVGWGLLNLLPMLPLDGGNALRAALGIVSTPRTAALGSGAVGAALGAAIAVWGAMNGQFFLMLIGGFSAWQSWSVLQAAQGRPSAS